MLVADSSHRPLAATEKQASHAWAPPACTSFSEATANRRPLGVSTARRFQLSDYRSPPKTLGHGFCLRMTSSGSTAKPVTTCSNENNIEQPYENNSSTTLLLHEIHQFHVFICFPHIFSTPLRPPGLSTLFSSCRAAWWAAANGEQRHPPPPVRALFWRSDCCFTAFHSSCCSPSKCTSQHLNCASWGSWPEWNHDLAVTFPTNHSTISSRSKYTAKTPNLTWNNYKVFERWVPGQEFKQSFASSQAHHHHFGIAAYTLNPVGAPKRPGCHRTGAQTPRDIDVSKGIVLVELRLHHRQGRRHHTGVQIQSQLAHGIGHWDGRRDTLLLLLLGCHDLLHCIAIGVNEDTSGRKDWAKDKEHGLQKLHCLPSSLFW